MSILIKGMEMPPKGDYYITLYVCSDGSAYVDVSSFPVGKDTFAAVPAADVRAVKEGQWVKARGNWVTPGGDPVWECSECGKGVHVYGIEHGTYGSDIADGQWVSCPNCGADMRGEKDE